MGFEYSGFLSILLLAANVWAVINIVRSSATTGMMVIWIVLVLVLPLVGLIIWFFAGPRTSR